MGGKGEGKRSLLARATIRSAYGLYDGEPGPVERRG